MKCEGERNGNNNCDKNLKFMLIRSKVYISGFDIWIFCNLCFEYYYSFASKKRSYAR